MKMGEYFRRVKCIFPKKKKKNQAEEMLVLFWPNLIGMTERPSGRILLSCKFRET
jgi:hypothetical protein